MDEESREDLMYRTRAAKAWADSGPATGEMEMRAFLGIFHPEMGEAEKRELLKDARKQDDDRRHGRA